MLKSNWGIAKSMPYPFSVAGKLFGVFSAGFRKSFGTTFKFPGLTASLVKKALGNFSYVWDWSGLKSLMELYFETGYGNHKSGARTVQELLARLHHLQSLEEFHLDQGVSGRSDFNWSIFATMTNVLKPLVRAKH